MLPEAYLTSIPVLQNEGGFRSFVYVPVRPIQLHDRICLDKIPRDSFIDPFSIGPISFTIEITASPWRHDLY